MKLRHRWLSLLFVLMLSVMLGVPGVSQAEGPEGRGMGLILSSPTRYPPSLPPGLKVDAEQPSAVDNTPLGLPPVGDQGSQNSCAAWATAYYYKTFQEKQERGWDVTLPEHQFSPAMVYNLRTAFTPEPCTTDEGMRFPDALEILIGDGALPLSVFPYSDADPCTQPTAEQLSDAYEYRSLGYGAFFVYGEGGHVTDNQIKVLKARLAAGDILVMGIPAYFPSFWHPEDNEDVVDVPDVDEEMQGFHAVTIVGYDDYAAGGAGAFKFANSWGPTYAGDGFAYLTYDFVKGYAREAWWMVDHTEMAEAVIYVEPASQTIGCDEVTTFAVAIRDVTNFYGAQFELTFDPTVIEVIDADGDPANGIIVPGDIFPADEYHVGTEVVDNDLGRIEYAITLLREPKAPPFSGSGTIAVITVRGLSDGVSPLVFASALVGDNEGEPISVSLEDGAITVECPTILTGHAYLESRTDHSGITVALEGTGWTTSTDASGAYTFEGIAAGTYTMTFSHDYFLTVEVGGVTVVENETTGLCGYTLLAGDLNNDDVIDILDIALCASNFGTTAAEGDVNADGLVDIYDLVLIGKNFKLASPQPGACPP